MTPDPSLAVVALSGREMRYAEVAPAPDGGSPRLLRLGTCDFDADAEAAVFGADAPATLATLADALRDVFSGSQARSLVVAVAAPDSTAFFTPLPAGLAATERDEQIRQETALLADVAPGAPVRVRAVPVRAEAAFDGTPDGARLWYHVLHVPEVAHRRLGTLAAALGAASYDLADASRAATAVVRALLPDAAGAVPSVALIVGAYARHTEVAVVRGGEFVFGHFGPGATPEDTAYYALAALEAAGHDAASIGQIYATGDALANRPAGVPARLSVLADLTGTAAVPLNAIGLFGRPVDGATAWELAAFAPVLGAALASASTPQG